MVEVATVQEAPGAPARRVPGAPVVRVGIVSWNTAAELDACLRALPGALDGLPAEVVVVDNASSDDSVALARRHGATVVANDGNRGYAVAMNQALAGTAAPFLVALNPDTVPGPGTLRRLVDRLDSDPMAAVAVPRLIDAAGRAQDSVHRFPSTLVSLAAALSPRPVRRSAAGRWLLLDGSGPHRGGRIDWAIGAVHVIRASALRAEAPYSERSFMYGEDLELCWRLAQRGAPTLLVDDVEVVHIGNAAGERGWGDVRSLRYWAATHDVVAQRRSRAAARRYAAGCALAAALAIVRTRVRGAITPARRAQTRRLADLRRRELAVHARAALHGPPTPPSTPPEDPA